ncbi:Cytosolic copper metallochaperone [Stylosanthes scabra]|uniref:Cytosolic copper metallochaperone n=1 Tax=Stylosanthes scabra TaxID=79078 RepID=A0ABU6XUH4_9FABA|nr:Cytosolic copper metallochaperone [Stylosanthes scabra]
MSCQGCVGAVNRVLGKMEGVESFDINLEEQKVTVKGNVQPEAVLQTVAKTGKKTAFWENEAPAAEPGNKPSEISVAVSTEPENKPSETSSIASAEPENKASETATVVA